MKKVILVLLVISFSCSKEFIEEKDFTVIPNSMFSGVSLKEAKNIYKQSKNGTKTKNYWKKTKGKLSEGLYRSYFEAQLVSAFNSLTQGKGLIKFGPSSSPIADANSIKYTPC